MSKAVRQPAYQAVAQALRETISGEGHAEGVRLPTELELAVRFSVSRNTIRRAYQELVAEGLVTRTPGRGSFTAPRGQYVRSFGSIEDLLALSIDTEMTISEPLRIVDDPVAADRLGVLTSNMYSVAFRRFHDSLPFCYTVVSLPLDVGEHLVRFSWLRKRGQRRRDTILGLLDAILPTRIVGARQLISALIPDPRIASLLDSSPSLPVLKIERLYFDENGRSVELATNYFHPERYNYRFELKRVR